MQCCCFSVSVAGSQCRSGDLYMLYQWQLCTALWQAAWHCGITVQHATSIFRCRA